MPKLLKHPVLLAFIAGFAVIGYMTVQKVMEQEEAAQTGRRGPPQSSLVTVDIVRQTLMFDEVESLGTAQANESIQITAKVADTINNIYFQDGEFVARGQVLVELTNETESYRLAEAQAAANDAKRQLARMEDLAKLQMIPGVDLDSARTAAETANARLEGVIVTMNDKVVRAPFSGLLGFRQVSEGGLVSPGTVITTLDDISTIKLDYTIPEVYLASIRPGQMITARSVVYRDREFEGEIRVVGSRVDPVTRSVTVRAHIDNTDAVLRPGMLLTIKMQLNERESLVVPEQAVIVNGQRQYVYALDNANVARQVDITLGRRRPGIVEVLSGLQAGQRIITEGVNQVRPGQTVQVSEQATQAMPLSDFSPNMPEAALGGS